MHWSYCSLAPSHWYMIINAFKEFIRCVHDNTTDFELTKDTPYLDLTGKLWGVFGEDFGENWPNYNCTELWYTCRGPGVGVTKPIFSVPLFSTSSVIVKTSVSYWISRLYLAGVAAAQLRRHLSNMNVIQGTFAGSKILLTEKLANGALVTPTSALPQQRYITNPVSQ